MPALSSRHSNGSALPEAIAMWGISAALLSPSVRLRGSRLYAEVTGLSVQELRLGSVILRRHLPICTTSGTPAPEGTLVSVNLPSGPVCATAIAETLPAPAQVSQDAPVVNGGSGTVGSTGTYT